MQCTIKVHTHMQIIHTLIELCSDKEIESQYNELICLRTEILSVENSIQTQFYSTQLPPKSDLTYRHVYIVVNRMNLGDRLVCVEFLFDHL